MSSANQDHKRNLIRGAAWTVGTRWILKGLGFINTIIMARLLMPSDYGVVAMAMITIGLIQTLIDFNGTVAILRKNKVTTEEINSAWTLGIIQGALAGILIISLTPIAISYFREPLLSVVLPVFALCVLAASIRNIGPELALKEYNFKLDFKIQSTSKIVSVLVTVSAGFLLRDYRALMLGIVAGYLTPLLLSYLWHPYRPRWNTSEIREIWAITKWLTLANVGNYILVQGDQFVAGRIGNPSSFGLYNVGSDLGQLPVNEVGPAMIRAILPVLSSMQDDIERMRQAVVKIITSLNTVTWALGLGFMAIAPQATEIILGKKWAAATPFVTVFALAAVLRTGSLPARSFLIVQGHTKDQSIVIWLEFSGFLLSAFILVPRYHLIGLAYARVIGTFINMTATLIAAKRKTGLPLMPTVSNLLRPITGAVLMGLLVRQITVYAGGHLQGMLAGITSGVAIYTLWCLITWLIFNKPEGLESTVLDKLSDIYRKRNVANE